MRSAYSLALDIGRILEGENESAVGKLRLITSFVEQEAVVEFRARALAKCYAVADDSGAKPRYVQFPFMDEVRSNVLVLSETVTEDTLTGSRDECEAFVSLLKGNNKHTCLKVVEVAHA